MKTRRHRANQEVLFALPRNRGRITGNRKLEWDQLARKPLAPRLGARLTFQQSTDK